VVVSVNDVGSPREFIKVIDHRHSRSADLPGNFTKDRAIYNRRMPSLEQGER
jgi:hypothetical protein